MIGSSGLHPPGSWASGFQCGRYPKPAPGRLAHRIGYFPQPSPRLTSWTGSGQLPVEGELAGKPMPFRLEGTMGDYNEPVEIKAPPKDKITDLPG